MDAIDTKMLIWKYREQHYADKSNNLGKMDKFLEKCRSPKLAQENRLPG